MLMTQNEIVDEILIYLDKLKDMGAANKRNSAYLKGVRDAMKIVQTFKVENEPSPTEKNNANRELNLKF